MRSFLVAAATALVALAALSAPATAVAPASAETAAPVDAACSPPCGYITPSIDVNIPEKLLCGAGYRLGGDLDPAECMPLMADGASTQLEGTLRWYWEMSEDGTYPNDPQTDIVISFSGSASNPDWLSATVEPAEFVLGTADLFDPQNFKTEERDDGTQRVWFWFERPITVTISRDGDPTPEDVQKMQDRNGVQIFYLKAKSSASGDRFREAFGIEEFRFYSYTDPVVAAQLPDDKESPGPALLVPVALLGAVAVALRRRRA